MVIRFFTLFTPFTSLASLAARFNSAALLALPYIDPDSCDSLPNLRVGFLQFTFDDNLDAAVVGAPLG